MVSMEQLQLLLDKKQQELTILEQMNDDDYSEELSEREMDLGNEIDFITMLQKIFTEAGDM